MSGAKIGAVRQGHHFDEAALARFMTDNIDGFSGTLKVQQFDAGQSNPTFLVEAGGTR